MPVNEKAFSALITGASYTVTNCGGGEGPNPPYEGLLPRLWHSLIAPSTVVPLDTEQTVWTKPPSAPKLFGATPHRGCSRVLSGPSIIQWCGVYFVRRARDARLSTLRLQLAALDSTVQY